MADISGQGFVRPARLIDAADFAAVQHRTWSAVSESLSLPHPPDVAQMERAWEHSITVPPSDRHRSRVSVDRSSDGETVVGVAAVARRPDPDLDDTRCIELLRTCG